MKKACAPLKVIQDYYILYKRYVANTLQVNKCIKGRKETSPCVILLVTGNNLMLVFSKDTILDHVSLFKFKFIVPTQKSVYARMSVTCF